MNIQGRVNMGAYLFAGVCAVSVEDDGIGFPAAFYRAVHEAGVVVTVKGDGLVGYGPGVWETLTLSMRSLYGSLDSAPAAFRAFFEKAVTCRVVSMDTGSAPGGGKRLESAGIVYRLVMPMELVAHARLNQQAILVGMGFHFEVWSLSNWARLSRKVPYKNMVWKIEVPDLIA